MKCTANDQSVTDKFRAEREAIYIAEKDPAAVCRNRSLSWTFGLLFRNIVTTHYRSGIVTRPRVRHRVNTRFYTLTLLRTLGLVICKRHFQLNDDVYAIYVENLLSDISKEPDDGSILAYGDDSKYEW